MMHARAQAKTAVVLALHAFLIWLACGLTIALGREGLGLETTLIVHAIVAPVATMVVSWIYFTHLHATTPLLTATFFVSFIVILDAAIVAPVFERAMRCSRASWAPGYHSC